jgi:hypothetical protein
MTTRDATDAPLPAVDFDGNVSSVVKWIEDDGLGWFLAVCRDGATRQVSTDELIGFGVDPARNVNPMRPNTAR